MNGRIHITKIPLVGRNLTIRFHIPLSCEQVKLFLSKCRVDYSKRNAVEGRIPSREEGVFPSSFTPLKKTNAKTRKERDILIGHRKDVLDMQMFPYLMNKSQRCQPKTKVPTLFLMCFLFGGGGGWAGSPSNHSF